MNENQTSQPECGGQIGCCVEEPRRTPEDDRLGPMLVYMDLDRWNRLSKVEQNYDTLRRRLAILQHERDTLLQSRASDFNELLAKQTAHMSECVTEKNRTIDQLKERIDNQRRDMAGYQEREGEKAAKIAQLKDWNERQAKVIRDCQMEVSALKQTIAECETAEGKRVAEVSQLKTAINNQAAYVQEYQEKVSVLTAVRDNMAGVIKDQTDVIDELRSQVKVLNEEVKRLATIMTARNDQIANQKRVIEEFKKDTQQSDTYVDKVIAEIGVLKGQLADGIGQRNKLREQVSYLENQLGHVASNNENQAKHIAGQCESINHLKKERDQYDTELRKVIAERHQLRDDLKLKDAQLADITAQRDRLLTRTESDQVSALTAQLGVCRDERKAFQARIAYLENLVDTPPSTKNHSQAVNEANETRRQLVEVQEACAELREERKRMEDLYEQTAIKLRDVFTASERKDVQLREMSQALEKANAVRGHLAKMCDQQALEVARLRAGIHTAARLLS